jgi:hypothetical protein
LKSIFADTSIKWEKAISVRQLTTTEKAPFSLTTIPSNYIPNGKGEKWHFPSTIEMKQRKVNILSYSASCARKGHSASCEAMPTIPLAHPLGAIHLSEWDLNALLYGRLQVIWKGLKL